MRRLLVAATLASALSLAALPVWADSALPSVEQIYQAEEAGHFDQAQQMISQVLAARPESAKAHFVQAELFARRGNYGGARTELSKAETLDPKEDFAKPRALEELKSQLGASSNARRVVTLPQPVAVRHESHFPWGTLLVLGVIVAVVMMLFRRRSYVGGAPGGVGPATYGPGSGYGPGPGYGPGYGPPGGGVGSGIAGGLASGLAVGAGVVAGEELAHHFLDGDRREAPQGFIPSADAAPDYNSDMGGNDFGVNDPGSWDDGGGGGGGGGDDWS